MFRVKLDDNEGGGEFIYLDLHTTNCVARNFVRGGWGKEDFAL